MSAIRPADALEAWRSDPRLPDVIRACHPSRASMDVTVAATADDDLLGMVTVCALGMVARVARSLGRTVLPVVFPHSLLCRLVEVEA